MTTATVEKPKKKKKKNPGKVFETNFFGSVPESVIFQRLKDDSYGFKNVQNMCDATIFNGKKYFLLELKTHLGKTMPVSALSEFQIEKLNQYSYFSNTIAGFVFNFRELEGNPTYFIAGNVIYDAIQQGMRSFNQDFCKNNGFSIQSVIKRVHYHYDIENFLNQLSN